MKRATTAIVVIFGLLCMVSTGFAGDHRIGIGGHYWTAIDDIDVSNIDEDGAAFVVSYQYKPMLFGFQFDVEVADKQLTGKSNTTYSPQIFVIAGGFVYGGVGIGTHYADGDFTDEPFYALKAGIDMELLPYLHLDINANYRFDNWDYDEVSEDVDTDTVTIGAVARIEF